MGRKQKFILLFGRGKWLVFCMGFLIGTALGIICPLVSTLMTDKGYNSISIGGVSSAYFLFIGVASILVYKRMTDRDLSKLISSGLVLAAVCSACFPLTSNLFLWFTLMSLMGVGISFYMIGSQTILHNLADESTRGIVSGTYALFFALGCVSSAVAGPVAYEKSAWFPFFAGGLCLLLASLIPMFKLKGKITLEGNGGGKVYRKIVLALNGVFVYSFIEATLVSLYPVYLLSRNYSYTQLGYALGVFLAGSVIGTLPFTILGDKAGREKAMALAAVFSIAGLGGIVMLNAYVFKIASSFIAGAGIGPIYPLAMAITAQNLDKDEIRSGSSLFTFSYGIASTAGPILSALVVYAFGYEYIFNLSMLAFVLLLVHVSLSLADRKVKKKLI